MMFGRYSRLVPKRHRDLIKRHRLPKPNWYVGSAEGSSFDPSAVRITPEMQREVDRIKAAINDRYLAVGIDAVVPTDTRHVDTTGFSDGTL